LLIEYIGIAFFMICFSIIYFYASSRHRRSKYTFSKNLY
jgi:cbb3-type cytochrome oxidase subunit 3